MWRDLPRRRSRHLPALRDGRGDSRRTLRLRPRARNVDAREFDKPDTIALTLSRALTTRRGILSDRRSSELNTNHRGATANERIGNQTTATEKRRPKPIQIV